MKIVLIGPVYPYRGGIAHYTTALATAIKDAGHEVKVFSFSRQYPQWLYPGKSDKDPSKTYQQIDALYTIDTINPISWLKTARLISQWKPDLVIFQWWTTFMAPAFFIISNKLKKCDFPTVYIVHNVYPHEKKIYDELFTRIALNQAKRFITHSEKEMKKLIKILPNSNTQYLPLPINDLYRPQVIEKNEAKKMIGVNHKIPLLLFFGIVRPYKGLRLLIQAVETLIEKHIDVQLLIAGEFWEDIDQYLALTLNSSAKDLFVFENRYIPNEELSKFFSACDIFVAPYTAGTQSATIKLAMSFGLPIIASDVIRDDLLREYPKFISFSNADPYSLSNSIEKTLRQLDRLESLEYNLDPKKDWANLVAQLTKR